ncbi:hypothetical protein JL722_9569 [Aureococcus anophagefferens]|nr:hypothetical protein JL722_9569 [Aureococcus anophagefferens]
MGAASGIMVAKEDAVFPDSGAYAGWPTSSVELCLEKYLSLRENKDVDMDGTIRVIFTKDRFVDDANAPPFGLVVEPFLSGVARIATEGKMDRQSVRRASSALQDGEMLMVRHVEAGSPASDAKVEADWLLSTVCGKIPKSASMMIFQALDAKNKMSVPTAEVSDVVALFTATLRHMRYLRQPLTDDALGALTESLASHAKNGRLDSEGFVEWGKRESKGGLLAALAHSATGTLGKYRKPVTLDAAHSKEAHARARRKYGSGRAQQANKKLGVAIATADATHNNSAKYDLEKVRKKHDGRVRAVASSTTMARLVSEVDFGYEDLHNLRLEFADASDRSGKDGPYLTCDRLKDMLLARFPSLENGRVLTDMLRVFDVNSNNKIYFPEFARALSKLVGSFEEQMSFIFALCDKDADGQLELWELSDLISDASDDMNELGDHIKARIPTFDDGGGFVEMVEFEALLKSDAHLYLNFYWTWVPFIGGNLLAGLELFEQVAIAVGVLPNFELALRMCPAFSAARVWLPRATGRSALELAQVLFGALGVPVPAGESFRALQPSEGDGVPAKDDGETRARRSEGMDEIPAARVWATVAHYLAARRRWPHQVDANLDVLSPSGMDFDEQVATSPSGATAVHPGRLTSVPQEIQAAIISRVVAFEAIEDDYHPDPIVSPSSRSLKNPPQLPKIPMAKIFTFTNEVCAIHDAWELTLAEAFEAMDANQDGSVSFDELLKYSRMNRELFQLMIGTGNRKTKGLIEYDAARVAEYDQVAHPEHPLPVLK